MRKLKTAVINSNGELSIGLYEAGSKRPALFSYVFFLSVFVERRFLVEARAVNSSFARWRLRLLLLSIKRSI